MKAMLFAILLCSSGLVACSQDIKAEKVPSLVKNALQLKFPDAINIEWEKNKKLFQAEYEVAKTEYEALINPSGQLLMYKQEIPETELPAAILAAIQQNFAGFTVNETEVVQKDGAVFYQVELEKSHKEVKKVFSADGNINNTLAFWD